MASEAVGSTRITNTKDFTDAWHGEVNKLIHKRRKADEDTLEDAMRKVQEAHNSNDRASLRMIDRHIELVKKSQALNRERIRKEAIERQALERKEEHSEILAEMAIRNAERTDLLKDAAEANRLRRQ